MATVKVYGYVKINEPNANAGTVNGDMIYFYHPDVPQAKDSFIDFFPVPMEIELPCGEENFRKICLNDPTAMPCTSCPNCDPDECDKEKYTKGLWTIGDIHNPPELIYKRRHKVDITKFISAPTISTMAYLKTTFRRKDITPVQEEERNTAQALLFENAKKVSNLRTVNDIEGKE